MTLIHKDLADGRWRNLDLIEQLANIGSEISRARKAQEAGEARYLTGALERALELFDLTMDDPKNRGRLLEVCRAREVVCDFFMGDNEYRSTAESLTRYFDVFAWMVAREREERDANRVRSKPL